MPKYIYVVKIGTLSSATSQFNLFNYYRSSLKKAIKLKEEVLRDNKAENVRASFNSSIYNAMVEAVDYEGENNKYTGRIIIDKEVVY